MIYLASPYSHPKASVRQARYKAAVKCVAELMRESSPVFSPIVHCHDAAKLHNLPKDAVFWWDYNRHFLGLADKMYLLTLDGWRESDGVKAEILWALKNNLPMTQVSDMGQPKWNLGLDKVADNADS